MRVAVLTISDAASRGEREDRSGAAIVEWIGEHQASLAARALVPDEADRISMQLLTWSDGGAVDVILTTGGIGPGLHDVVQLAVEDEPEIEAVRVAVKPGQPQCAGRLRSGAWLFALPGNPVSAAVGFELFVRPALLAAQGRRSTARLHLPAIAAVGWRGAVGRAQVLPVRLRVSEAGLVCEPTVNSRAVSHAVGGQGAAEGFAWVPEHVGDVDPGDPVEVWRVGSW